MSETYDYHKRKPHNGWLLAHIDSLLFEASKYSSVSPVLYAALECRNLLEKTEFELIIMSSAPSEWETIAEMAKGKNGLNKTNKAYKALKYRFQSFSEAYTKVIMPMRLKVFNFRKSEEYQHQLSEYLHIYTRTPEELIFDSLFIQSGINLVEEVIAFVKSYYTIHEKGYVFGILNFNTLTGSVKKEFEEWKGSVSEDVDSLYNRLKSINDTEAGGAMAEEITL